MIQIKFNNADSVQLVTVGSPKAINYTLGSGSSPVFTCSDNFFSKNDQNYYCFAITGSNVQLSGVIDSVTTKQQFMNLFKGQTAITDASELQLTASSMTEGCYANMFLDCTNLTTPPSTLPATNLDMWCYSSMFGNCSALTAVPTLPATNLAKYCYYAMFYGCKNIVDAPYLPASVLTDWCYNSMFYDCQKLTSISADFTAWQPSNATSNWVTNINTNGMFYDEEVDLIYGVDNIPQKWYDPFFVPLTFTGKGKSNAVQLSAKNSPESISLKYKKKGQSWTTYNIGNIIPLSANEMVAFSGANDHFSKNGSNCYQFVMTGTVQAAGNIQSLMDFSNDCTSACYTHLFQFCSSLITPPQLPATGLAYQCYAWMFAYSNILNTPQLPATTLADWCYYEMFHSCHSLLSASAISASTVAEKCCQDMFSNCTSLTSVPSALPATTLAPSCYMEMFSNCSSLLTAPQLPATALASSCYRDMFQYCTSLTSAPSLPASSLVTDCYLNMFRDCSNLSSINVNLIEWSSYDTLTWLYNVAEDGTFYKPSELTDIRDASHIPEGWTVVNK